MSRGGFRRALKVVGGIVVTHRPVDDPDVQGEDWIEVTIPKGIPISLNEGIAAGLLSVVDGKLTWPEDARDLHDAWVAARLKERFRRPAFAFAVNGQGQATGSGRSVPGADLGRVIRAAVDQGHAVKGGGHAMAAGATVSVEQIPAFAAFVGAQLAQSVADSFATDRLMIDATISAGGANPALLAALEQASPFGLGCPEPVFALANHRVVSVSEVGSGGHMRVRLASGDGATIDAVAFRAAGQPLGDTLLAARGRMLHVAGSLNLNTWGGRERVEMRIMDVAEPV